MTSLFSQISVVEFAIDAVPDIVRTRRLPAAQADVLRRQLRDAANTLREIMDRKVAEEREART